MMRDYQDQHLEVVRAARTGLFMIRIDYLVASMYQDPANICLMVIQPSTPEPSTWPDVDSNNADLDSEDDFEDFIPSAYPTSKKHPLVEFKPSLLSADTAIVTCGLLNLMRAE